MSAKSWMMLQLLLNRFHHGPSQPLFAYLPKEEAEQLSNYAVEGQDISPALQKPDDQLQNIHYSWIAPTIQGAPEDLKPFLLASLPENYTASIKKLVNFTAPIPTLSPPAKEYFLKLFFSKYHTMGEHLPLLFVPPSKLGVLLTLSKQQLVEVIDFLGLQDLAEALRHIVDKARLKRIYGCLSAKKQQYLRVCLHQKDRLGVAPMELNQWDGNIQKLETQLHRRGLMRLGVALSGQHPEFIWHLSQLLDTGRGGMLTKNYKPNEIPNVTAAVGMQVLSLIKFLYKQEQP